MLDTELQKQDGILIVRPQSPLTQADFRVVAAIVDPYIQANGQLTGLLIEAEDFPGWHDLASFISHMRFVHDHHKKIARVAAVSDSRFMEVAPTIAKHFVNAQLKHFPADEKQAAMRWLKTGS